MFFLCNKPLQILFSLFPCALPSPVYLAALSEDEANVCRDPVPTLDLHDVPNHQLVCWQLLLLGIPEDKSLLKDRNGTKISLVPLFKLRSSSLFWERSRAG